MWKGGASFEPYCPKFNTNLKERVRDRFDRRCPLCDKQENENIFLKNGKTRKLSVHHVYTEKMACCESRIEEMDEIRERLPPGIARFGDDIYSDEELMYIRMMAPLCDVCHRKFAHSKKEQETREKLTEIIINKYGGMCWLD
jgi:hypothetical protein